MEKMRKIIINEKFSHFLTDFTEGFISKLITGDGTLDIYISGNSVKVKVNIVDKNQRYRKDYKLILRKLGFMANILDKYRSVYFSCPLLKLLYLYKIKAFYGSENWNKLLKAIDITLQRRRGKSYFRLTKLIKSKFSIKDLSNMYKITKAAAWDWVHNMEKKGYIMRSGKNSREFLFILTETGVELVKLIQSFRKNFGN